MKIVVTGGHLTPALAIISQLIRQNPKIKFYFFGRRQAVEGDNADSFEFLEVTKLGIPFFEIPTGRLQRKFTRYSFFTLLKIFPGFVKSAVLLLKIRPDMVLTFGGYLALPVAVACAILRIPTAAHEQSPNLGLANKIIFKLAKLKGVSERSLQEKLGGRNLVFTGPLLRSEIFEKVPKSEKLAEFFKKVADRKLIYITGGATGSHFLNQITLPAIPKLLEKDFVIAQTGNLDKSADYKKMLAMTKDLPDNFAEKLFVTEFVSSSDIGAVLSEADLVITRAGANTTSELAALAKVAIIIPLEWGVEQKKIAANLEKTGSFIVIFQTQAKPEKILEVVDKIFNNFENFSKKARVLQTAISHKGAKIFAQAIINLV